MLDDIITEYFIPITTLILIGFFGFVLYRLYVHAKLCPVCDGSIIKAFNAKPDKLGNCSYND